MVNDQNRIAPELVREETDGPELPAEILTYSKPCSEKKSSSSSGSSSGVDWVWEGELLVCTARQTSASRDDRASFWSRKEERKVYSGNELRRRKSFAEDGTTVAYRAVRKRVNQSANTFNVVLRDQGNRFRVNGMTLDSKLNVGIIVSVGNGPRNRFVRDVVILNSRDHCASH